MDKAPAYKKLMTDANDLVGAVAYAIYKRKKHEFIANVQAEHGHEPTPEQYGAFYLSHCTETAYLEYRDQATQLFNGLVSKNMNAVISDIIQQERQGMLSETLKDVAKVLETSETKLDGVANNIGTIRTALSEKKGAMGWVRDCATVIVSTLLVILIIGLLTLGLNMFDRIGQSVEHAVGTGEHASRPSESDHKVPPAAVPPAPATSASP